MYGSRTFRPATATEFHSAARSTLLILGSFAIAWNLTITVHELGHLVADRIYGLEVGIVLEPFRASYITVTGSTQATSAWLDAAGPLANLIVGALLTTAAWRAARPAVFPLLLWGPLALLQESTNALVQLATRDPGTDWVRIVDSGIPGWFVWVCGAAALVGGFVVLMRVVPVAGLTPAWTVLRRVAVLGVGFGGYPGAAVLISVLAGYSADDISRNVRLLAFILLVAALVAVVRRPQLRGLPGFAVTSGVVVRTLALGTATVVSLLVI